MPVKTSKPVKRGGSAGGGAKRSQVTGRQLGKADLRAARKNAECISDYMSVISTAASAVQFMEQTDALNTVIARVVRGFGAGRFEVALVDGSEEQIRVAGSVSLRGHAATKTDRDNCMCVGDFILVRAGLAAAKLPHCDVETVRNFYDKHRIPYPKRFFGCEEEGDDLFDYSDEHRPALDGSDSGFTSRKSAGVAIDGDCDDADDDSDDDIDISLI